MKQTNQSLHRVSVIGTGSFLPNDPVPNSRLEDVLGPVPDAPKRVQGFIKNMGPKMLESGGVESRHFAIDPETHRLTHTVAALAEEAARRALESAQRKPTDVELLVLACPNYDHSTPPTSAILQQRLGIQRCAEMEIHSNCTGVGKAVQVAYDSLRLGRYRTALVVYPQLSSVYLRSCYFKQAAMNKTEAALRYILADGAGAVMLETAEGGDEPVPHEVLGTFIESVGGELEPGMTAGGGVADLVEPDGQIPQMSDKGTHHLGQDFSAVSRNACPFLIDGVLQLLESLEISTNEVAHYVFSIPGRQLYDANWGRLSEAFGADKERLKFRAANTGYIGGASVLLHFDEIVRNGELQPGQIAVMHSVESSKWMSGGFVVRW